MVGFSSANTDSFNLRGLFNKSKFTIVIFYLVKLFSVTLNNAFDGLEDVFLRLCVDINAMTVSTMIVTEEKMDRLINCKTFYLHKKNKLAFLHGLPCHEDFENANVSMYQMWKCNRKRNLKKNVLKQILKSCSYFWKDCK